ncbi:MULTISPECIES: hypothetical protein [unclassified Chryseobacterium]|uniref:hypothetical protein n=1 Tax=unclassified Chryseobacterium TaxID=2593645 RepID=UPI000D350CC3|nr:MULTISPECIES: hypothetical protein [unclassified Chryseobacterium]PTT70927.1 hypothetical protein DBR25_17650 [Chryseobacterium sp. HMWF001]PVV55229.1 hypothetical protein DD829_15310 [Chryseobacterium sp. HMWF035]
MKKNCTIVALVLSVFAFSQTGNVGINTVNPMYTLHIDGGKDNPSTGNPTTDQQSNDFVVTNTGKVGIGTASIGTGYMLNIVGPTNADPTTQASSADIFAIPGTLGAKSSLRISNFQGKQTLVSTFDATTNVLRADGIQTANLGVFYSNGDNLEHELRSSIGGNQYFIINAKTVTTMTASGNVGMGIVNNVGNLAPVSTLDVKGSLGGNIRTLSSGTIADNDFTLLVQGAISLPVPSSANIRRIYHIINDTTGTQTVTGNFRLNGSTFSSYILNNSDGGRGLSVQSDGNNWIIISKF